MKKAILTVLIVVLTSPIVFSADVVVYQGVKQEDVPFAHKAHVERLGGTCYPCHEGAPVKIVFDKKDAHSTVCLDCHKKTFGPVKCDGCHWPHDGGSKCRDCH